MCSNSLKCACNTKQGLAIELPFKRSGRHRKIKNIVFTNVQGEIERISFKPLKEKGYILGKN